MDKKYELMQRVFSLDSQRMELENRVSNLSADIEKSLQDMILWELSKLDVISDETRLVIETFGYQVENGQLVEKEKSMNKNEVDNIISVDVETVNRILENPELGPMGKVSELMNLAEDTVYKTYFTNDERNLFANYAYKFQDMDKVVQRLDDFITQKEQNPGLATETLADMQAEINEFDKVFDAENDYKLVDINSPKRYDANGNRLWFGKTPEQFTETERVGFLVSNELELDGVLSQETEKYLEANGYKFYDQKLYKIEPVEGRSLSEIDQEDEIPKSENTMPKQASEGESQEMHYRGYAYVKGQQKPHMLHANTPEEIVMRLQSWNKARPEDLQFKVVNIGALDNKQNKFVNYHKYEVATGKDISSVYLELPKMAKDEFLKTVDYLKENGVKYLPQQKKWYITADMDTTPFKDFLPDEKIAGAINAQPEDSKKYSLLLSKDVEANECMVAFNDGREPITLHGDQFGVNFAQFKTPDEVVEIVDDFIKKQMTEVKEETLDLDKLQPGDKLECYVPEYVEEGYYEVAKMVKMEAVIESIGKNGMYFFSECSLPDYLSGADKFILFSESQANIINRAIETHVAPEVIRVMTNSTLSVGQMDVLCAAAKDGFFVHQVEEHRGISEMLIAHFQDQNGNMLPAPDMDMMRIGLQNGVDKTVIQSICGKEMSWAEKRQALNGEIRLAENKIGETFKKQGYPINRETARKVIQLNHCTHQKNKLGDIADAYKNQTFKDMNPKAQSLVNDIAKECQVVAAMQSQVAL